MRDKIEKVIRAVAADVELALDQGKEELNCAQYVDVILALEVPVWCGFYGRKCICDVCSVTADPETCKHKSSATIKELIGMQ